MSTMRDLTHERAQEDVDAGAQPHLNALAGFVNKRTRATLTVSMRPG
jgi:hypothetical protein